MSANNEFNKILKSARKHLKELETMLNEVEQTSYNVDVNWGDVASLADLEAMIERANNEFQAHYGRKF